MRGSRAFDSGAFASWATGEGTERGTDEGVDNGTADEGTEEGIDGGTGDGPVEGTDVTEEGTDGDFSSVMVGILWRQDLQLQCAQQYRLLCPPHPERQHTVLAHCAHACVCVTCMCSTRWSSCSETTTPMVSCAITSRLSACVGLALHSEHEGMIAIPGNRRLETCAPRTADGVCVELCKRVCVCVELCKRVCVCVGLCKRVCVWDCVRECVLPAKPVHVEQENGHWTRVLSSQNCFQLVSEGWVCVSCCTTAPLWSKMICSKGTDMCSVESIECDACSGSVF